MITCTCIGGLANNLFQICMLLAFSIKHKLGYCIPTQIQNSHYINQKIFYSKYLNYKNIELPLYLEKGFTYEEIPFMDNVCFQGYWQSEKYFKDYLPQIKKLLGFDCKMKHTYTCAIHVRRGDYLNYPSIHPTVTIEYIQKAISRLCEFTSPFEWIFKFYSDDIDWCRNLVHSEDAYFFKMANVYEFSVGKTEEEDFRDMLGCRHFIISNSSFSLLAAILSESPDKVCIAPSRWFGDAMSDHDIKDLLPSTFITI